MIFFSVSVIICCKSFRQPSRRSPLIFARPIPSTKARIKAVITPNTGSTLMVNSGENSVPLVFILLMGLIHCGSTAYPKKYARRPASTVEQ